MQVELKQSSQGVLLPVQAQPGARRNAVVGVHDGRLKVAVTQAPEKGKANKELAELIAGELGLAKSQVRLTSGETSRRKVFCLTGISLADVESMLARVLESR